MISLKDNKFMLKKIVETLHKNNKKVNENGDKTIIIL